MNSPDKKRPARIERALAAACMALLCLITFANVLVRYLSNVSFAFTEEFSVFLLLMLTLLGSVAAFAERGHIRVTLLIEKLPTAGRKFCAAVEGVANVMLFALLAWFGASMALDDYQFEVTSPGLGLPQWWYTVWLPLLATLIALRLLALPILRRRGKA